MLIQFVIKLSENLKNNMSFLKNPCNIYITLWCVYLLQGTLYEKGSMLSQVMLVMILLMSFYHVLQVISSDIKYFRGYIPLLVVFSIYGVILFVTDGDKTQGIYAQRPTYIYIKDIYMSLLPIASFYYFTIRKNLDIHSLSVWIFVFFIIAIANYYKVRREVMEVLLDRDDIVNNSGYVFASLIPCVKVFKKRVLAYICIAVCILFTMFAMKRGAIVVCTLAVLIYFYVQIKESKGRTKFLSLVLMGVTGMSSVYYMQETLFQNDFFNSRLEATFEGYTSHREDIYAELVEFYTERATFLQQLVGIGANGTLKVAINYAHNDWLEILINQGVLGILFFLNYWIMFFKTVLSKTLSQESRQVLFMIFVMTLVQTFFSMSIGGNTLYLCTVFGFALADGFNQRGMTLYK